MMNKSGKNYVTLFFAFTIIMMCIACNNSGKTKIEETTTRGNIKIAVDEAYQLLFDTEVYTFESLYTYAKIHPIYKPEGDAVALLLQDCVRVVVVPRKLSEAEDQSLRSKQFIPKTTKIAIDALAIIINKENKDSLLLIKQIGDIFLGKINNWKQINPKSTLGNMTVVFDNNKSCNTRYIKEKFKIKNDFPDYCYAVKTNNDVVNYVEKNKNAIGIISVNWISDRHDSVSQTFLNNIRVVSVGDEYNTDGTGGYYKPYQGSIFDNSYPFTRDVYMINREPMVGLGTGFVQFVAGEKGQLIIKKSGIIPATQPIRIVKIKQ
jgi:phosphate transport system substrate-binding protein